MNEKELRELDVQVHTALHPGATFDTYIAPSGKREPESYQDGFPTGEVPHYSTDIGAWEPIYALKPEWMWDTIEFYGHTDTVLFYDVWREDPLLSIEVNVPWDDARGLAAYALGRARCVITWAGSAK